MIAKFRNRSKGQALVEFALILIVLLLFIFIIIEAGRLFQGWLTVQNSARAAGRYALTGNYETECLFDFPACLDPRVYSIKEEALRTTAGLSIDPNAIAGTPKSLVTEVWSTDLDGLWKPDFAGGPGDAVRVKVTYHMPIVVPLFRVIAESVGLVGQVVITNEEYDQVATSRSYSSPPDIGDGGGIDGPPQADVSISKTVVGNPPWVYTGHALDWEITVQNNGSFDVEDVVVFDTLPAGTVYLGSTVSGGGYCEQDPVSPETIICYLPNLAGDGGPTSFASAIINTRAPDNPGTVTNIATVTNGPATVDPNLGNNTTQAQAVLRPWADVEVVKTDNEPPSPRISQPFSYIIGVRNNGLNIANGVVFTDTLPAEVTYVNTSGPPGSSCLPPAGTQLVCSLNNPLPPDPGGPYIDFVINVLAPDEKGFVYNQVTISASEDDLTGTNNFADETTTIDPAETDLSILKFAEAAVPVPYPLRPIDTYVLHRMKYTLDVLNNGQDLAPIVKIEDRIRAELILDPSSIQISPVGVIGSGTCNTIGNGISCTLTSVPNGAGAIITMEVMPTLAALKFNENTLVPNEAKVSEGPNQNDPDPVNNIATINTLIKEWVDLSITKEAIDQVYHGDLITYTLSVFNAGPVPAENVTILDTFSIGNGAAQFFDSAECVSSPPDQALCSLGTIPVGGVGSAQLVVETTWPGYMTNEATVSADEDDLYPANNTDDAETYIGHITDLEVVKLARDPAYRGERFAYRIYVRNHGPSPAINFVITDTLPISVTGNFVTPNFCDFNAGEPTCTDSMGVGPGWWGAFRIYVTPDDEGQIKNTVTVTVTGDAIDPDLSNNTFVLTTTVEAAADLEISKDGPDYFDLDNIFGMSAIEYTLTITNNGPSVANNVTITDVMPFDAVPLFITPVGVTCSDNINVVTCDVGQLGIDASMSVVVYGNPDATGYVTNYAEVYGDEYDPDSNNNTDTFVTFVDADVDLLIEKTGPNLAHTGEILPYQIVVSNLSPYWAHGVRITDTLPLTVTHVSSPIGICDYNALPDHTVTCDLGDIAGSGGTAAVTINVRPQQKGVVLNTVIVDGLERDPELTNNKAELKTPVDPAANLEVTKTAPAFVSLDDTLPYTVTVRNLGPYTATSVVVTDTLPVSVTIVSASQPYTLATGTDITFNIPVISPSSAAIINITVQPTATGVIVNEATAMAAEFDPAIGNNTDTAQTTVRATDLEISKDADPIVYLQVPFDYDLTVTNNGPYPASNVVVTDTLPTGAAYVDDDAGCNYYAGTHTLSCTITNINPGSASIEVTVEPIQTGVLTNTAGVQAYEYDPAPANNTVTFTNTVLESADLEIFKTGPLTVTVSQEFDYELVVVNNGPSDSSGFVVTDTLPANVNFVDSPNCSDIGGGEVFCSFAAPFLVSDRVTFTISVSPTAYGNGTLVNMAEVDGEQFDPLRGNNTAIFYTTVTQADLEIVKSAPGQVTVQEIFDYKLDVTNNGPSDATGVLVTDTLPANIAFITSNRGCVEIIGHRVTCALGDMDSGDTVKIVLTVVPTQSGTAYNFAEVYGDQYDHILGNNFDDYTTIVTEADLEIGKSASEPAYEGAQLIYTLVITNLGPSPANWFPSTTAVFSSVPLPYAVGLTLMVKVILSLTRKGAAKPQVTSPPPMSEQSRLSIKLTLAGSVSVTTKPVESDGPLLTTTSS